MITNDDYILKAKRELLWGTSFMDQFHDQLIALYNDQSFMNEINKIKEKIGHNEFINVQMAKTIIKDEIWKNRLPDKYKQFKDIVDKVKSRGSAGTSAYITVYFSLRIMEMQQKSSAYDVSMQKKNLSQQAISELDYRKRWPADYRCEDGHYVRSKSEMLIDNWLYSHGICHAYEKAVFSLSGSVQYICDFYVPFYDLYIEFWGLDSPEYSQYQEKRFAKINFYKNNNLRLVELSENEIMLLDDKLGQIFR
jgi:hypothetical protein